MIDLHMHSLYSDDGEFTPENLIFQCKEKGIHILPFSHGPQLCPGGL